MNRKSVRLVQFFHTVNGITYHIHHTALDLVSDRHRNRMPRRNDFHSALQPVRTVHGHAAYRIFTDMLLHFNHQRTPVVTGNRHGIVDFRQGVFHVLSFFKLEVHIDHRTDYLRNVSNDF